MARRYPPIIVVVLLVGVVLVLLLLGAQLQENAPAPGGRSTGADTETRREPATGVLKSAMPAVVNISTTRRVRTPPFPFLDEPFARDFFGDDSQLFPERRENSLGSGVIVDEAGLIITNEHVIAQADQIKVLLGDRREFTARVVGTDPNTDIAVIRIDARNLHTLPWGDSDKMEVGQDVFAIGNSFGLTQTVTAGIVSAVGRANVGIAAYEDFIQTDAAINPGNSGGALINRAGELIGINTAIFSQTGGHMGIGFAVPSNMARAVMDSLIKTGRVVRGYLGVSVQEVTSDLAKQFGLTEANGALVTDIVPGGPAAKAGIRVGDVITGFNGKEIDGPGELRNIVAQAPLGKQAQIRLVRDKKPVNLQVQIAEQPKEFGLPRQRPAPEPEAKGTGLAGMEVRDLTPEIAHQLRVKPGTEGVVITVIDPNSDAAAAGLRPGDVITEVRRKPVRNIKDYETAVSKLEPKEDVLLLVSRAGSKQFVVVER